MTPDQQEIQSLVGDCLSQLRRDLALPEAGPAEASTAVYGEGSDLDSMAVVHLIVDLEARLLEKYGRNWILADERALSRRRSPFRTVGDLAAFIVETTPRS